jgi:hypothetical protein
MINSELRETTLGESAFEYIERALRRPRELCRSLQRNLELKSGKITTYLPPSVKPEAIHQFELGGKLPQPASADAPGRHTVPIPNLYDALATRVVAHLNSVDSALCIFENGVLRPHHPALHRLPKIHTLICEDTVCHFLTAADRNDYGLIINTIKVSGAPAPPYLVGCASRLSTATLLGEETVDSSSLDTITEYTKEMFIGAYDGEGFLIWSRLGGGPGF